MFNRINENKNLSEDSDQREIRKSVLRGTSATVLTQISIFAIHFVSTIWLARLLTPQDFGLVGMVLLFSLMLQNFGMRGFTEATIQTDRVDQKMLSTLFWLHVALSIGLSIAFIGISPAIAWFYSEPRLTEICAAITLTFIFSALSTQPLAILNRKMEFIQVSACQIIAALASDVIAIVLAAMGWGYWSLLARRISLSLVSALAAWLFCRWMPSLPGKVSAYRSLIKFAMHTYGNFIVNYFSRNFDYFLISWKHGAQPLANYQKAYDLFVLPANQLTYPLTNVFVASLSRYRSDPEQYKKVYLRALDMLAFVAMPLSPVLTLTGKDIILFLLGPQWEEAGYIFSAFGISIGIMVIYGTHGWLHLSLGTARKWFYWGIAEFIITGALFVIGLPYGSIGVACGWSLSYYILLFPGIWIAGRGVGLSLSSIVGVLWRYFAAALLSGFMSMYFMYYFPPLMNVLNMLNPFFRIIFVSTMTLLIYTVFMMFFYRSFQPILQFIATLKELIRHLRFKKESVLKNET